MKMNGRTESAASICWRIRQHFETERLRLEKQIRTYPRPIAGCDAQFNYLLDERGRIAEELQRLEILSRKCLTRTDAVELLDEFIASSNYIRGEVEQRIRSALPEDAGATEGRSR